MAYTFKSRNGRIIKMRILNHKTLMDVAILFKHPMNMGYGTDRRGNLYSPEYIEKVQFYVADILHTDVDFGMWISRNPLLRFDTEIINEGTSCKLLWLDNQGVQDGFTFKLRYGEVK